MFCKKCGKRISDDAAICPNCGTATASDENENITEIINSQENEVVSEEITETHECEEKIKKQTSLNGDSVPSEDKERSEIPAEKKKIKKGILISGIIAAVLCVAIVILTFPYIKNAFARIFMSSEDYFTYVVKNNSKESAKSIANTLDSLKRSNLNGTSSVGTADIDFEEPFHKVLANVTSDVKIGGTVASVLGKFMDVSVGGMTEWIDEVSVDYEMKSDGKNSQSVFELDVNKAKFGTIDVVTDIKSGNTYIGVPDYCDGYFIAKKNGNNNSVLKAAEDVLVSLPEKELAEKLIIKYIECIAENVGAVEETKKTAQAGKFTKKFVALRAEIDKKEMNKITEILFDEIENDGDIAEIIKNVSETSGKSERDVKKSLKEAFENFNKFYSDELKGNMTLTLYVDAKGDIAGTEISAGKFEYSNFTITKWFEIGNTVSAKAGILELELDGNGKLEGNNVKIDYTVSVGDSHIAAINISDLDYKKMKDGLYDAKIKVAFDKNIAKVGSLFDDSGNNGTAIKLLRVAPDMILNIDLLQKSAKETAVNLKINYKNELAVNINVSNKIGEKKSVKIPDKYVDTQAIGIIKALATADMEKFVDFLGKAEFPNAGMLKLGYKLIFR